jgi:hypothetical protein
MLLLLSISLSAQLPPEIPRDQVTVEHAPFLVTCACRHQVSQLYSAATATPTAALCGNACRFSRAVVAGSHWRVTEGTCNGGSWRLRSTTHYGELLVLHNIPGNRYNILHLPSIEARWDYEAPLFAWNHFREAGITGPFLVGILKSDWALPPNLATCLGVESLALATQRLPDGHTVVAQALNRQEAEALIAPSFPAAATITDSRIQLSGTLTGPDYEYSLPPQDSELRQAVQPYARTRPPSLPPAWAPHVGIGIGFAILARFLSRRA